MPDRTSFPDPAAPLNLERQTGSTGTWRLLCPRMPILYCWVPLCLIVSVIPDRRLFDIDHFDWDPVRGKNYNWSRPFFPHASSHFYFRSRFAPSDQSDGRLGRLYFSRQGSSWYGGGLVLARQCVRRLGVLINYTLFHRASFCWSWLIWQIVFLIPRSL